MRYAALLIRWFATFTIFMLAALWAVSAPAQVPGMGQLNESQLQLLSPQQREDLVRAVVGSGGATTEQQLSFPQTVLPLTAPDGTAGAPQLFDRLGQPLLDSERRPLFLTQELLDALDALKIQSPEDWLASEQPFLEQDIELKRFGYDLFAGVPTTFAPATDVPVPPEYRLGPGDTIDVQLFGKENRQYSLVVRRDGTINFPNIGPITVIGDSFEKMKQQLLDRVAEQLIGTSAAINMGSLRSIQVLVLGDARRPGAYTVSGLSTITNALFVSGGVKDIGSLRNVQLKREGKVVTTLDLYDLLLRGDATNDVRLESGDVIFIPTVGATVGVGGFVKRPAIYELKTERTVQQVVQLAGGLRPDAYPQGTRIERFDEQQERSFINIDLLSQQDLAFRLAAGDTLLVPPVLAEFSGGVWLKGLVQRPGIYQWQAGMRLTDLLPGLDRLTPQADSAYVLVRRETHPDKRIAALSADLVAALADPQSAANIELRPRDQVWIFGYEVEPPAAALIAGQSIPAGQRVSQLLPDGTFVFQPDPEPEPESGRIRTTVVQSLLDELRLQAEPGKPFQRVTVDGLVRVPGEYPYEGGMRVSTVLRAGAGPAESAYMLDAELTRYSVLDGRRTAEIFSLNIERALAGDPEHDVLLQPQDFLAVRRLDNWANEISVTVRGEVRFPGRYPFVQGDTVADVVARAGGLTEQAFPEGALFLRQDLREREQQQLDRLRERLAGDLALLSLRAAGDLEGGVSAIETQSAGRSLLADLDRAEAVGRLVIDLPQVLSGRASTTAQVLLKDRDELLIPGINQEVTIIGEVFFPTSHLHERGMSRDAYIQKSGGITGAGSKKNIYVVKANGAVMANGSRFFSSAQRIEPGDTIVVPLDTEQGFRLRTISSATSIVFNLAIAAAAISGLSN